MTVLNWTKWTPRQLDKLEALLASGASFSAIAKETGKTRNSVAGRVFRDRQKTRCAA